MSHSAEIRIALRLPPHASGNLKADCAEALLEMAYAAGREWISKRALTDSGGAPLTPERALSIGLEYGDSDIKLSLSVRPRVIAQIVPEASTHSLGAFLREKQRLDGRALPLFSQMALRAACLVAPKERVQAALSQEREEVLFAQAANRCVHELGALAHAALLPIQERLIAQFAQSATAIEPIAPNKPLSH